jgi:hypothetical protein
MTKRSVTTRICAALVATVLLAPNVSEAGKHTQRPVGSVIITGDLDGRVLLTFDEFSALPLTLQTLTVMFKAGSSEEAHTFTGFLLYDVMNYFHPQFDPAVKNDKLRFSVSATGTDGYQAIVAWGEFDPGFEAKPIMLAITQDGQSLSQQGIRLVVPDDIHGGRYVSLIDIISLDRVRQPDCDKNKPLNSPKC